MRLTISKYYLPSGKSISEVGVTPDILVEEEGEDFQINSEKDNQLNYAIKLLIPNYEFTKTSNAQRRRSNNIKQRKQSVCR